MDNCIIKRLSPADIAQAKELIRVWQEDGFAPKKLIPGDESLYNLISSGGFHAIVAIADERIVGGLTAYELTMFDKEEKEMFLYDIAVIKGYRNEGIAKGLIEELKKVCVERGISVMFVGTTLDNDGANQLYRSTGGEAELVSWFTYNIENN